MPPRPGSAHCYSFVSNFIWSIFILVSGLFIRHMLLAFDKLSFSLVTKLCNKLNTYFDAAFEQCLDESVEVNSTDSPLDEKLEER